MKLTTREKTELFGEGVITLILLLLLNLSVIVLFSQALFNNPGLKFGFITIKHSIFTNPGAPFQNPSGRPAPWWMDFLTWQNILSAVMGIVDLVVIYWRLLRRYHLIQLRHVIDEIHYIADGHFDHRIPFKINSENQKVVDSVNSLVDSVIESMDEERSIERSKDELITNVSHDIRTPLTSIIGYLGLIEAGGYRSQAELLKYTHIAFFKSKQMKSLADDLFEYSKARTLPRNLQMNRINVKQLVEQLAISSELEAEKKNIQIETECKDNDIFIEADAEKLGRVFNNLITNALKYGKDAKHIYLTASQVNSNEAVITVSNDGEPIPKKSINQIFERFYRVETSRNKATGGTGLGLAIVQNIVDSHNGFINVESNRKLTSFAIHLPVHADQPLKKSGFEKLQSTDKKDN
ncbi:HAMP domain-containing histidine kinase [Nicoliella spurrieriana]|uniref:histidine kinase n=1 Tax=Nicoliella spurrieriana TaxID=2925830 RepID=A0A976RSK9_9LACO|nr:HAMP domain-containing sensor histidine kinase [Nicoliella spurrieriana]UQS87093.1 HAMP domain-containing histidine kinase [Nicoliella spurrieriana]